MLIAATSAVMSGEAINNTLSRECNDEHKPKYLTSTILIRMLQQAARAANALAVSYSFRVEPKIK